MAFSLCSMVMSPRFSSVYYDEDGQEVQTEVRLSLRLKLYELIFITNNSSAPQQIVIGNINMLACENACPFLASPRPTKD